MQRLAQLFLISSAVLCAQQSRVTVRLYRLQTTNPARRIQSMTIEDYVAGILAGEASMFSSDEPLKAMAVAARTYAVHFRGRHRGEGFDFCDNTHCQDFRPNEVTARMRAAAQASQGELLWYGGSPAATYYHRNCGGSTEAAQYAWAGVSIPYLRQQPDGFCIVRGRGDWHSEITKEELRSALLRAGVKTPSPIQSLIVTEHFPSGRARRLKLRLIGSPSIYVPASTLRLAVGRFIGWDRIRSDLYRVQNARDRFVFHGFGAGHGVGLCQVGAARMGEEGWTSNQILDYYYPGTTHGVTAQKR